MKAFHKKRDSIKDTTLAELVRERERLERTLDADPVAVLQENIARAVRQREDEAKTEGSDSVDIIDYEDDTIPDGRPPLDREPVSE